MTSLYVAFSENNQKLMLGKCAINTLLLQNHAYTWVMIICSDFAWLKNQMGISKYVENSGILSSHDDNFIFHKIKKINCLKNAEKLHILCTHDVFSLASSQFGQVFCLLLGHVPLLIMIIMMLWRHWWWGQWGWQWGWWRHTFRLSLSTSLWRSQWCWQRQPERFFGKKRTKTMSPTTS